jgi:hypothetical protein
LKSDACNRDGRVGDDERWSAATAVKYGVVAGARYAEKRGDAVDVDAGLVEYSLREKHARCPPRVYGVLDGLAGRRLAAVRYVLACYGIDRDGNISRCSTVET